MQHGVMDRVRDGCGFQKEHAKKSRSGSEHVRRASEREGSRKDLASTRALCPRAHSVLFQKTDQTEKKTRRNQSRYSDWRYRWKQLNVYTVRATAVGRDTERNAVLAGDPKEIRLLYNTTLITDIPSRGSKEERIRIHLQVWANIRNNGCKR